MQAGIIHEVIISELDESKLKNHDPVKLVQGLASAKAEIVASRIRSGSFENKWRNETCAVLGCDSVFEFEGEVFGKPSNQNEAIRRWEKMSAKSGFLHTGHSLDLVHINGSHSTWIDKNFSIKKTISTKVNFVELSKKDIEEYVATGEPLVCAGGFALEGKGSQFISSIEGCYSNVIGLSLPWLRESLTRIVY